MIKATRLDGSELWVNAEMIEFIEATPDTVVSLVNETKVVVKESPEALVEAIIAYRQKVCQRNPQIVDQ